MERLLTLLGRRAAAVTLPQGVGDVGELAAQARGRTGFLRLRDPSNAPSSTRAIVVSLTDAVNHPIKLTKPSLGVVS